MNAEQPPRAADPLQVHTPHGSYPILIGGSLLSSATTWQDLPRATHAVVVSNPTVFASYGAPLLQALQAHYSRLSQVLLPDDEEHKHWATLNLIFDHLLQQG